MSSHWLQKGVKWINASGCEFRRTTGFPIKMKWTSPASDISVLTTNSSPPAGILYPYVAEEAALEDEDTNDPHEQDPPVLPATTSKSKANLRMPGQRPLLRRTCV
jgi:hypothetical protein